MSEYNSEYQRLLRYVDAACSLADACAKDITIGKSKAKYTNETILALSKFVTAHNDFSKLVDTVRNSNVILN